MKYLTIRTWQHSSDGDGNDEPPEWVKIAYPDHLTTDEMEKAIYGLEKQFDYCIEARSEDDAEPEEVNELPIHFNYDGKAFTMLVDPFTDPE